MHAARFLGARLAGQNFDDGRFALHQALQGGLHVVESLEAVHALGAATELSRRLRATQEQHAQNGGLAPVEVKNLLQTVLVLGDAAIGAAGRSREVVSVQCIERLPHRVFIQIHHRFAVVLLVARVNQRVQRKRIVIRGGDVFLNQRAQHASLYFVQRVHWQIVQNKPGHLDRTTN